MSFASLVKGVIKWLFEGMQNADQWFDETIDGRSIQSKLSVEDKDENQQG